MYRAFFQLQDNPFSLTPDPDYLYLSASHREALAHLDYGVRERKGFIEIVGAPARARRPQPPFLTGPRPDAPPISSIPS
jgi:hypothetical protein